MNTETITQAPEITEIKNDINKHSYLIDSLTKKKKLLSHGMFCIGILLILAIMSKAIFFIVTLVFTLFFAVRFYNKILGKIAVYNAMKAFLQFNLKREQIGDQSLPPFLQ